ncbi:MAG: DUF1062 domain-containing protein [Defluviitaleaceae bacterium]|nr:DUF1062 domain-containing protein [Defluviitaleaceae bacterium]
MNETIWTVTPTTTPTVIRHCSKCNRKSNYYCSEKFRANANQQRVDVWLIYKCTKCDSTLKLTIYKGIRPKDLPPGLFDKFVNNDAALAWEYAFNRNFLKQQACVVDYAGIEYTVESPNPATVPLLVQIKTQYPFDLKLSVLLAKMLNTSISQIKKLAETGNISASPEINIIKHRIKSDTDITLAISSLSTNSP